MPRSIRLESKSGCLISFERQFTCQLAKLVKVRRRSRKKKRAIDKLLALHGMSLLHVVPATSPVACVGVLALNVLY